MASNIHLVKSQDNVKAWLFHNNFFIIDVFVAFSMHKSFSFEKLAVARVDCSKSEGTPLFP